MSDTSDETTIEERANRLEANTSKKALATMARLGLDMDEPVKSLSNGFLARVVAVLEDYDEDREEIMAAYLTASLEEAENQREERL